VADEQAEQRNQPACFQEAGDEGQAGLHRRGVPQRWQFKRDHSISCISVDPTAKPARNARRWPLTDVVRFS
jgi:hypothetical protein